MLHNQIPAVQLVPEYTVVEAGRVLHHLAGILPPRHHADGHYPVLAGNEFAGYAVEIRNYQIRLMRFGGGDELFCRIGRQPVVAVHKLQVVPAGFGNTEVARGGCAGVGLVNHTDAGIFLHVAVTNQRRGILAAVIHQNQLQIGIGLLQNAVGTAPQGAFGVIHRNNHGYHRVG